MTSMPLLLRVVLFAASVGVLTFYVVPPYQEIWPEPSPAKDPFYYVDYEKSDTYYRRMVMCGLWPWVVGFAASVSVGLICWVRYSLQSSRV